MILSNDQARIVAHHLRERAKTRTAHEYAIGVGELLERVARELEAEADASECATEAPTAGAVRADRPIGCSWCGIAVALVDDPVPPAGKLCDGCERRRLRATQNDSGRSPSMASLPPSPTASAPELSRDDDPSVEDVAGARALLGLGPLPGARPR